jgi:hypothetical protein
MSELASELRRIADQIERWARYDDVMAPGLPDAETLRRAANALTQETAEQSPPKKRNLTWLRFFWW